MEGLVPVLDPREHVNGLAFARRIDLDGLEPALERPILLDVFPVFRRRRRADAADFAARERRLQDVRGIEGAFSRAGAHERVQLVDEHDDVRVFGQFLHDRLEALFELTAVFRARDDERDVERKEPLVREEMRDVAVDDLLGEPFDDRGLPDARFADEHGVVLGPAAEHLLHALDFDVAPHERIEVVLHRRFREIAAELGEQRRFLHSRQRGLLVQQRDDVFAHGVEPHPLFHEDGRRNRTLLTKDAQQQMLGTDVVVEQAIGLFRRKLQHPLRFRAERDLDRRRDLLAEYGASFDFLADTFERQVGPGKNTAREPFALPNQPKKEVLGFNGNAPELARFVARKEQHAARSFRIAFEHPVTYVEAGLTLLSLYGTGPFRPIVFGPK